MQKEEVGQLLDLRMTGRSDEEKEEMEGGVSNRRRKGGRCKTKRGDNY